MQRMTRLLALALAVGAAPLAAQDEEPIVTNKREVTVDGRALRYTTRAGRIPIRDNETGDVHGQMFFVSYTLDRAPGQATRPLTFVWNGGPGSNAALVHLIGFGPKRIAPQAGARPDDESKRWVIEPNPGTWLGETDLVFVDPIGTGYSRPVRAEYGPEFYQTRGDFESVAEFIRVYRTRFDTHEAPLFLAGESYGVTRASGVAEALQRRGTEVKGVILLGLALPLGSSTPAMRTALSLPSLAVAAFTNKKLAPDLQRDLGATMQQAESWAVNDYARFLARADSLSQAERDSVVRTVSRFTGLDASMVDRRTLAVGRMQLGNYLLRREMKFIGQYDTRMIGPLDTTQGPYDPTKDPSLQHLLDDVMVLRYLRNEVGYKSDLRYQGPFGGGYPPPTAFRGDWMSVRWNRPAPGDSAAARGGGAGRGGRGGGAPNDPAQPLRNAMTMNPSLRVLAGCGIYDLVCDYHGVVWSAANLDPAIRRNVVATSYPGGHAMYTDPRAHKQLQRDVAQFIRETLSGVAR
jgi:carboxypeptidase C (cathepsin A)